MLIKCSLVPVFEMLWLCDFLIAEDGCCLIVSKGVCVFILCHRRSVHACVCMCVYVVGWGCRGLVSVSLQGSDCFYSPGKTLFSVCACSNAPPLYPDRGWCTSCALTGRMGRWNLSQCVWPSGLRSAWTDSRSGGPQSILSKSFLFSGQGQTFLIFAEFCDSTETLIIVSKEKWKTQLKVILDECGEH